MGKLHAIPTVLCGAANSTTEAYAVFRTGPHQPWHLVALFDFEFEAREEMARLKRDDCTDGLVLRHVSLGRVTQWNRPRPKRRTP